MSDITLIDDSEQSSLVTNGLARNGEMYLKKAGSTDAGSIVVYDSGAWKTFANEYTSGFANAYSVDLDGSDDYVMLGNLGTAGLSLGCLSLWVNSDTPIQAGSSSARGYLAGWGSGSSFNGFSHGLMNNAAWILQFYHGAYRTNWNVGAGSSLGAGWHHIVLNHNGTGYEFYVDGVNASSHPLGGTVTISNRSKLSGTNIDYFRVGINGSLGFPTGGLFDEVGLWNNALTATQISEIYNSGVPISLSSYSPDGWWRMGDNDGGTGTTITDQSGNGNDGTLTNGPTFSSDVPS
jgi:hypothetical protein